MRLPDVLNIVGITTLSTFLFFLLLKAGSVRLEEHQSYQNALTQIYVHDALINQDILRARYELLISFDSFVEHLNAIKKQQQVLNKIPDFISVAGQQALYQLIRQQSDLLVEKENLLEQFKSKNAILKNSLNYLSTLNTEINQKTDKQTVNKLLQANLSEFLFNTLLYNLMTDKWLVTAINTGITQLSQFQSQTITSQETNIVNAAIMHAKNVLRNKPEVDKLTRQLLKLTLLQLTETISQTYHIYYQKTVSTSQHDRLYIYGVFLCLAAWITYLFIAHLLSNNRQLADALKELQTTQQELIQSEKMAALGQLVAGIAHEINTPLGAIRSSIEHVHSFLAQTLTHLPYILRAIPIEHYQTFSVLLQQAISAESLTSKEKRQLKRTIRHQLETHQIHEAILVADILVDIGVRGDINTLLPLLRDPIHRQILDIIYQLASLQKSTQTITTASERATKTIFALKSFIRRDHMGKKVKTNIIEGIETVLTLYHNQIRQQVKVIRQYIELPLILCYPDELNQVWTHLIHNALQAMSNKGVLTIEISQPEKNQIIVGITDTGKGIPDEIKTRIFEPFFTTKPTGEGSGLGLDIVRKVVERHQGYIIVDSQPGKTTFRVYLPILE